ncbi:EAL domain-containing protein [Massilia solisilvae]|uniref:EAL domain-containing protein n=1 Tax=Massilia solisilvae TaxID=1811225 RepID=A0ABT2BRB5_9BURK|nr:EAL domain-containing protein [Massilia solisilvae]MCS0611044.1 EAL domain-containing protein [Massilia solisilvae]
MSTSFGAFSKRAAAPRGVRQRSRKVEREQVDRLRARFDLICQATSDGLWDAEVGPDPARLTDPATPFWWSQQFRNLLGFRDEREFPNVLGSLLARLHPEDLEPTLNAFRAHVQDRSGQTPYDVACRLRCRSGEFRWFRARGHTRRAADGRALRFAGAMTDITDRNTLVTVRRNAETIIASLPAGLLILDEMLRVVGSNDVIHQILGLVGADDIRGLPIGTVLPQEAVARRARDMLERGGTSHGIELRLGDKWLRLAMTGVVLEDGRRVLIVAEDVTAEQRLRKQAREHATRHRDQAALLDKARDAIVVRGMDGTIQFWNKGAERMYGWSADEVLGRQSDPLLYPTPGAGSALAADAALASGEWSGELEQRRKDGSVLTVEGHWTLVRGEDNEPKSFLVINTDVTQRKASDERIRTLALYDTLTGLPNRSLFADRLSQGLAAAAREGGELAVLFIDLNRFKEINDTQGHGVGDEVLVKVARRFQGALREHETLARLAGDEFVVIAQAAGRHAAAAIAGRLEHALAEPVGARGHTFSVGLSIGISIYPEDGASIDDLLRCADIAMYRAKAGGGGHLFYQPQMSVGLAERMELARDLMRAFNQGELQLYYQPQVSLDSGELVGAEALVRWQDRERGWVSPSVFIPIAEARGMIGALGSWVLREACRQLGSWRQHGLRFPGRLSVNLAAQQLEQAGIAERIQQIAGEAGVEPDCLELELTESGLMANVERAIGIMGTLKEAGFSIAIDDFGTGYSSLAYLKRLPADKLKIDISFVREMLTDRHDYTIVNTIIGMARNLRLKVIAEGVEQPAQAEALLALGCDEAQGYYYGKPVPAEEFARQWLA